MISFRFGGRVANISSCFITNWYKDMWHWCSSKDDFLLAASRWQDAQDWATETLGLLTHVRPHVWGQWYRVAPQNKQRGPDGGQAQS